MADKVDLTPSSGTASAAQRGLAWLADGKGGKGLVGATISDARKMAKRKPLSEAKVRRMPPWFARHAVDLNAPKNKDSKHSGYPGPGTVAWALWGGNAGRSWSQGKVGELDKRSAGDKASSLPSEVQHGRRI
jgi:hypothetical protein